MTTIRVRCDPIEPAERGSRRTLSVALFFSPPRPHTCANQHPRLTPQPSSWFSYEQTAKAAKKSMGLTLPSLRCNFVTDGAHSSGRFFLDHLGRSPGSHHGLLPSHAERSSRPPTSDGNQASAGFVAGNPDRIAESTQPHRSNPGSPSRFCGKRIGHGGIWIPVGHGSRLVW